VLGGANESDGILSVHERNNDSNLPTRTVTSLHERREAELGYLKRNTSLAHIRMARNSCTTQSEQERAGGLGGDFNARTGTDPDSCGRTHRYGLSLSLLNWGPVPSQPFVCLGVGSPLWTRIQQPPDKAPTVLCYSTSILRGLNPQANYTDRATAACQRS
jgi:hypothetical protein